MVLRLFNRFLVAFFAVHDFFAFGGEGGFDVGAAFGAFAFPKVVWVS